MHARGASCVRADLNMRARTGQCKGGQWYKGAGLKTERGGLAKARGSNYGRARCRKVRPTSWSHHRVPSMRRFPTKCARNKTTNLTA